MHIHYKWDKCFYKRSTENLSYLKLSVFLLFLLRISLGGNSWSKNEMKNNRFLENFELERPLKIDLNNMKCKSNTISIDLQIVGFHNGFSVPWVPISNPCEYYCLYSSFPLSLSYEPNRNIIQQNFHGELGSY